MKKLRKFLYEWNIGKREILTFVGMILMIVYAYIVLLLSAIIYAS